MLEFKPFLNPAITVKQLALDLGTSPRYLSEIINDHYGISFSEYINRARVKEAKRLMSLAEFSNQSLLDIALDSGFNSKSSFNLMFKRYSSVTPSEYRKAVKKAVHPS
ncbi:helix-turn-helix domain-containing protein [Oceanicoccus sp. KOV_DT_Chl]|uniref:helix-turn-helix domain-containing protein n=1 Tax=Oceanicoccus sp. KOV_DT_Chl TaxID=1904639 RepID=UPI000C7CD393